MSHEENEQHSNQADESAQNDHSDGSIKSTPLRNSGNKSRYQEAYKLTMIAVWLSTFRWSPARVLLRITGLSSNSGEWIRRLVKKGVLEKVDGGRERARCDLFFLTKKGRDVVQAAIAREGFELSFEVHKRIAATGNSPRKIDLNSTIHDIRVQEIMAELMMNEIVIPSQITPVPIVLEMSGPYPAYRPDGLISINTQDGPVRVAIEVELFAKNSNRTRTTFAAQSRAISQGIFDCAIWFCEPKALRSYPRFCDTKTWPRVIVGQIQGANRANDRPTDMGKIYPTDEHRSRIHFLSADALPNVDSLLNYSQALPRLEERDRAGIWVDSRQVTDYQELQLQTDRERFVKATDTQREWLQVQSYPPVYELRKGENCWRWHPQTATYLKLDSAGRLPERPNIDDALTGSDAGRCLGYDYSHNLVFVGSDIERPVVVCGAEDHDNPHCIRSERKGFFSR